MVCVYCGNPTQVANSRLQKRDNQVWRRRKCVSCKSIFTTREACDLTGALVVKYTERKLIPFSRDKLLLSVYESCKHRDNALEESTALTQTIISDIQREANGGMIDRQKIALQTQKVLKRFDPTAATVYGAYHRQ